MSQKTVQNYFCQNFAKFPPTVKIFGTAMVKRKSLFIRSFIYCYAEAAQYKNTAINQNTIVH